MGGDRWGCAGAPPPVVVVVVAVVQGFKGEVLLKDCSVRHATSLSPIQTLPAKTRENCRQFAVTPGLFLTLNELQNRPYANVTIFRHR